MKHLFATFVALLFTTFAAFADPVDGTWKTQVDDGRYAHVRIKDCDGKVCGIIAKAFDANGPIETENVGKLLVWDMIANGDGTYSGGKIWQPSTGKIYKSKMTLDGNTLFVSGCVGPICKKQTWTRVD